MTQNIYDNDEFFAGYSRLPRSVEGLDGAPEWPALQALLPDLRGRRVLDLGCGFGWFCRWSRQRGAAHVEGIDVSEKMLARARATTSDPAIVYVGADLERLALRALHFDLVYSSLALHYIVDLKCLLTEGVIKQHRTLATYLNVLLRLGFTLSHVEEWGPSAQQIALQPKLADEHERPPFLLVAARR